MGPIGGLRVGEILVEHLKHSQEETDAHVTKDAVFLAVEEQRVAGTVQNDTFEIAGGYFLDADSILRAR